jgi:demethylmenaquinone methyltransferase/2-methoxy-6-polyprenyl-1,4-benzoquinol methylase
MPKDLHAFRSPEKKAGYVNAMFARIAGRYDLMNRIMSLGRDQSWRRRAIHLARVPPGGRLLDVAIGTGDLALSSLQRDPTVRVTGVDFTDEMMRLGRRKEFLYLQRIQTADRSSFARLGRAGTSIGWTGGDALRLPYPDEAFDAVVSGFMMRNVTDITAALAEQRRVVRRAGRVVCLEITRPKAPVWRHLYGWLFGRVIPTVTGALSKQPDAYRYLPASLESFVSADELQALMVSVGLRGVGFQTMMLGTVAIHVGVR